MITSSDDGERLKRYPKVLWGPAWSEFLRVKGRVAMICTEELFVGHPLRCTKPFCHLGKHEFVTMEQWRRTHDNY